jgi:hypothetical protein
MFAPMISGFIACALIEPTRQPRTPIRRGRSPGRGCSAVRKRRVTVGSAASENVPGVLDPGAAGTHGRALVPRWRFGLRLSATGGDRRGSATARFAVTKR